MLKKVEELSLDQRMVQKKTTTHTITYHDRLTAEWATRLQYFFGSMVYHLLASSRLLPLQSTKDLLTCKKQSLSVSAHPLRYTICTVEILLKTCKFIRARSPQSIGIPVLETSLQLKKRLGEWILRKLSTNCSHFSFLLHDNIVNQTNTIYCATLQ